jgi:hypothetical protein
METAWTTGRRIYGGRPGRKREHSIPWGHAGTRLR